MTCCIVGLMIWAAIGRLRRLFGRRPPEPPAIFAPVAHRPAPGQAPAGHLSGPAPAPTPQPRPASSPVLRYCATAVALWLIAAHLLVWSGGVTNTGSTAAWLVRDSVLLGATMAALALARVATIWHAPAGAGTLLIVVGAVVFELGVIDMHVFRVFGIGRPDVVAMMAFHNAGPLLAILGLGALLYGSRGRTWTSSLSSRSTVISAAPAGSAATVASTPPLTA